MRNRLMGILGLALLVVSSTSQGEDHKPADVTEPPPYHEFLVIPLRVHILTSSQLEEVDCRLTDPDVARILRKVNGIWHKAGVHWALESLRREPAARQDRYRLARDLDGRENLGIFTLLLPDATRSFDGLHVYYIHRFSVNGIWMGEDFAIVQETARLKEVEGGIDEPLPRVTAHELGHALGLSHRQDRTNLLASGTTGTLLNTEEAATSRRRALRRRGVVTTSQLTVQAEAATSRGEIETARRLWTWLSEVPGAGAAEARKRLDDLEAGLRERPGRRNPSSEGSTPGGSGAIP